MILDALDGSRRLGALHPLFPEAFSFLECHASSLEPGRHEIRGGALYASVSDYRTRPLSDLRFEAHERYIDIQLLSRGRERILWSPAAGLEIAKPYHAEKDILFFEPPREPGVCLLEPGLFAVFFPSDAHAPGGERGTGEEVRKIVVKVRVP